MTATAHPSAKGHIPGTIDGDTTAKVVRRSDPVLSDNVERAVAGPPQRVETPLTKVWASHFRTAGVDISDIGSSSNPWYVNTTKASPGDGVDPNKFTAIVITYASTAWGGTPEAQITTRGGIPHEWGRTMTTISGRNSIYGRLTTGPALDASLLSWDSTGTVLTISVPTAPGGEVPEYIPINTGLSLAVTSVKVVHVTSPPAERSEAAIIAGVEIRGVDDTIALGTGAQAAIKTGDRDIAIGTGTQAALTDGTDNVAVGTQAQPAVTVGSKNIAIGSNAQLVLTDHHDNFAIGFDAQRALLAGGTSGGLHFGNRNIAIGNNAQKSLVDGGSNIAIGHDAQANMIGGTGSAVAVTPMRGSSGGHGVSAWNVAIGNYVQEHVTTGTGNVGLGGSVGNRGGETQNRLTGGSKNVAVGVGAQALLGGASSLNVAIGAGAHGGAIGSIAGPGVGTPDELLGHRNVAVGTDALRNAGKSGVEASNNVAVGTNAGIGIETGSENVAIGRSAMEGGTPKDGNVVIGAHAFAESGDSNVVVGRKSQTKGAGAIALGAYAFALQPNTIQIGEGPKKSDHSTGVLGTTAADPVLVSFGGSGTGTAGQVLTVNAAGTGVEWAAAGGATVTTSATTGETALVPGAAVIPTPAKGDIFLNTADGLTWIYTGATWQAVGGGGGVKKYEADVTLVANTAFTVTHNLNTQGITVSVWDGNNEIEVAVAKVDANSITLTGTVAGTRHVVVIG